MPCNVLYAESKPAKLIQSHFSDEKTMTFKGGKQLIKVTYTFSGGVEVFITSKITLFTTNQPSFRFI